MQNRKIILRWFYIVILVLTVFWISYSFVDTRDLFGGLGRSLTIWLMGIFLGGVVFLAVLILCLKKKLLWVDSLKIFSVYLASFAFVNFLPWADWYTSARFTLSFEELKQVVAQMEENGDEVFDDSCEGKGRCYKGTVILNDGEMMAFVGSQGIVDNWGGVVYDPTGLIEEGLEKGYDANVWNNEEFRELKGIFNGDLMGCSQIEENWFNCSFT